MEQLNLPNIKKLTKYIKEELAECSTCHEMVYKEEVEDGFECKRCELRATENYYEDEYDLIQWERE